MNDFIDKARELLEEGSPEKALEILRHLDERPLGSEERRGICTSSLHPYCSISGSWSRPRRIWLRLYR